eukprot:2950206-Amphidinium_carterae.1
MDVEGARLPKGRFTEFGLVTRSSEYGIGIAVYGDEFDCCPTSSTHVLLVSRKNKASFSFSRIPLPENLRQAGAKSPITGMASRNAKASFVNPQRW